MTTTKRTLVTFHIGRGGHFHNQGHVSFVECGEEIEHYTNNFFLGFENGNELWRLLRKKNLPTLKHYI